MKKKTIWLIESGCYSDYHIVGVFSSKENAERAIRAIADDDAKAVEWEIDPLMSEINKGYNQYQIIMLRDGTVESISIVNRRYLDENKAYVWDRPKTEYYKDKNIPAAINSIVWARNEKHAIKITNELRTQFIAEGKWK